MEETSVNLIDLVNEESKDEVMEDSTATNLVTIPNRLPADLDTPSIEDQGLTNSQVIQHDGMKDKDSRSSNETLVCVYCQATFPTS